MQHQVWTQNEIRQLSQRIGTIHAFRATAHTKTSVRVSSRRAIACFNDLARVLLLLLFNLRTRSKEQSFRKKDKGSLSNE